MSIIAPHTHDLEEPLEVGDSHRDASGSVEDVVMTVGAIWLGISAVSLTVFVIASMSELLYPFAVGATLVLFAVLWAMTLVLRRWNVAFLVAGAVVGSVVSVVATPPHIGAVTYPVTSVWLQLTMISAAVLLRRSVSSVIIMSVAGSVFVLMVLNSERYGANGGGHFLNEFVIGFDALAFGMAVAASVYGMRRIAVETDVQTAVDAARAADIKREEAAADEEFRWACITHDTAINTLAAVAGGLPASAAGKVSARAESDLAALSAMAAGTKSEQVSSSLGGVAERPYDGLVEAAVKRAASLGLELKVRYEMGSSPVPTDRAREGLLDCVREALLNVSKHSETEAVALLVIPTAYGVTIVVDDYGVGVGVGDEQKHKPVSLEARAVSAGLSLDVVSLEGRGTSVRLTWATRDAKPNQYDGNPRILVNTVIPMVRQMTGWLFTLYAVEILILQQETDRYWSASALAGSIALTVVLSTRMKRMRRIVPWLAWVSVVAVGVAAYAPSADLSGCARMGPQFWGPNCGIVLAFVIILYADNRLVTAGTVVTYLGTVFYVVATTMTSTSGCGSEGLVKIGAHAAILLAIVLLWRYLSKNGKEYEDLVIVGARDETERIKFVAETAIRSRWTQNMLVTSTMLLKQIANGADISNPSLRKTCEGEASFLRAMLVIPVAYANIGDALSVCADEGCRRNVPVRMKVASPVARQGLTPERLVVDVAALADVISRQPPGEGVTVSVRTLSEYAITVTDDLTGVVLVETGEVSAALLSEGR